jgi:hypothetical protein
LPRPGVESRAGILIKTRATSRRDFTALVRPMPTPSAHWFEKFRTVEQSVMA